VVVEVALELLAIMEKVVMAEVVLVDLEHLMIYQEYQLYMQEVVLELQMI
tara:strand:+ start:410 stop:559 length:150 start_codon:yes stop_codon:yes gene_type:complete